MVKVPPVALFPNCLVQQKVLSPFRNQVIHQPSCVLFVLSYDYPLKREKRTNKKIYSDCIISAGGGNYLGCKACKGARMGHQCGRRVSSLLWGKRRWILCLCGYFSLHPLCLCEVKHIEVLTIAPQMSCCITS